MIRLLIVISMIPFVLNAKTSEELYMEYLKAKNSAVQKIFVTPSIKNTVKEEENTTMLEDFVSDNTENLILEEVVETNSLEIKEIEKLPSKSFLSKKDKTIEKVLKIQTRQIEPIYTKDIELNTSEKFSPMNDSVTYEQKEEKIEYRYSSIKPKIKNNFIGIGIGAVRLNSDSSDNKTTMYEFEIGKKFNKIQIALTYMKNRVDSNELSRKVYLLNVDKNIYTSNKLEFYIGGALGKAQHTGQNYSENSVVYGLNLGQRFNFNKTLQASLSTRFLKENFDNHNYSIDAMFGLNILF